MAALADFNWPQVIGYGYGLGVRTHMDKAASGSLSSLGEFGFCYTQHCLNPREEWYLPRLRNVVYDCLA